MKSLVMRTDFLMQRKKKLLIVSGVIAIALIVLYASADNTNYNNLCRVRQGMTTDEVLRIMGSPVEITSDDRDTVRFCYRYINPALASSDDFKVYFSKPDSTATYVYYGQ
jgi:outer membrane protein assembly factor BamE (lipoprotein component of BamABCDE complex)